MPIYIYTPIRLTPRLRPTLAASALGLISIAFNLFATRAYRWSHASMSGLALSGAATLLYGSLLVWRTHRTSRARKHSHSTTVPTWSEPPFYANYNANMYPTVIPRSPSHTNAAPEPISPYPVTEDEAVTRQMAILLRHRDPTPSPNATSTFQIAMPVDQEQERRDRSQELVGTPGAVFADARPGRGRAGSRPDSLGEQQAWERWQERGRPTARPSSTGGTSSRSRNLSREERRTEIELGAL